MLFHLVKKEFLIVKKYVLIMLIAAILIPPVMRLHIPQELRIRSRGTERHSASN